MFLRIERPKREFWYRFWFMKIQLIWALRLVTTQRSWISLLLSTSSDISSKINNLCWSGLIVNSCKFGIPSCNIKVGQAKMKKKRLYLSANIESVCAKNKRGKCNTIALLTFFILFNGISEHMCGVSWNA